MTDLAMATGTSIWKRVSFGVARVCGAATGKMLQLSPVQQPVRAKSSGAMPAVVSVSRDMMSFAVRDTLQEMGFFPGSVSGARRSATTPQVGFGLLVLGPKPKSRAKFVGTLWLRGVSGLQGGWRLDVYGSTNIGDLTKVAHLLSATYGIPITVRLADEVEQEESKGGDW